ncbi:MAG: BLUF domain-containing protein [Bdellovibrionales bacterium]|nr:BLUF domain-containing protein [Ramlibacter sp.]
MQLDDLEEILQHARDKNAAKGISGALVYVDGVFLQILEGDARTVEELMVRIACDVRHETVTVLKEEVVSAATFTDWSMAYVSATPAEVARWAGLSGTMALPEILSDMRNSPFNATRLAESIFAVLTSKGQGSR